TLFRSLDCTRDDPEALEGSCDLWNGLERGPELLHEAGDVEPVIREHFVVGATLGQLRHADARHARRGIEAEPGDRRGQHLSLAAVHVMVVERHDRAATADGLLQPRGVDPIEPRQVDEADARAGALLDLLRRMPGVREHPGAVAEDHGVLAGTNDPAFPRLDANA